MAFTIFAVPIVVVAYSIKIKREFTVEKCLSPLYHLTSGRTVYVPSEVRHGISRKCTYSIHFRHMLKFAMIIFGSVTSTSFISSHLRIEVAGGQINFFY